MEFKDQYGNIIRLKTYPRRIVSLVPSQTELLYHLGLENEVVGITKFCIYPSPWFHSKTRVGGPKKLKIDKIKELKPDLIIGNKEENVKEEIEALQEIAPVWLSDVYDLKNSLEMISSIAEICDRKVEGTTIIRQIESGFNEIKKIDKTIKVIYMIWKDPFMAVGSNTFIHNILTEQLGLENAVNVPRYPEINPQDYQDVDYVFLSTEPYPFGKKHIPEIQKHFPKAKIIVVDGEYFTWYGSRLAASSAYFKGLLENL